MEAGEEGADYVAFGAFYDTTTKPSHYRPAPEILTWWTVLSQLPCVAIGGIFPDNAAPLVAAGADFIAVVRAVWDHPLVRCWPTPAEPAARRAELQQMDKSLSYTNLFGYLVIRAAL
jgi:thiamine monophosphate synthase